MKKIKFYSLLCLGLMALTPVLSSCDKDDDPEVEILLPIAGDYLGAETCDAVGGVPGDDYEVHIYNSANDPNTIWIENAYGFAKIKGSWDGGNGFTVPSQEISITVGPDTYTGNISGSGRVEGDELIFDFETTDDLEDKCTFKGNRRVLQPAIGM